MMEYELYWNKNDKTSVPTSMVISGSFKTLTDARAYAFEKIQKSGNTSNIFKKSSKIIEIVGVDSEGYTFDSGRIGTFENSVLYVAPRGKKSIYKVSKNGTVRKM